MLPSLLRRLERKCGANLMLCSICSKPVVYTRSVEFHESLKSQKSLQNDFVPKPSDPNVFGTLNKEWRTMSKIEKMPEEEDEKFEVNYLNDEEGKTRLRIKQYADIIKGLAKEKRIPDAIDVLEKRMLQEDNAKPDNYIYNLVIGICARVGYTKKAFQLFNQMKKRGLKVTGGTYSSLFNACANSPWEADGLKRANHLRQLMKEKAYSPNQSNYHAMIKAYGRCKDIPTAFMLVDEMLSNRVNVTSETINFLLQACVSDKEDGFRHALLVWRKMLDRNIIPTTYTYNLLLRCVRDCGVGSKEDLIDDIRSIIGSDDKELLQIEGPSLNEKEEDNENITGNEIIISEKCDSLQLTTGKPLQGIIPNLLAKVPHTGSVVSIKQIAKPKHRLLLVGGISGFLEQMAATNTSPDIKTFTQLLEIIPSTLEAENVLLESVRKFRVPLDIDFCNMLIKKRNMRDQHEHAKDVLNLIRENVLKPNIMTFGVLAIGCRSREDSKMLLKDLSEAGFRPNIEILGTLLKSASRSWDLHMIFTLMNLAKTEEMEVNQHFMRHLDEFHERVQKELAIMEKGGRPHNRVKDKHFLQSYMNLCHFCKHWKKEVKLDDADRIHPWDQFRRSKNKD